MAEQTLDQLRSSVTGVNRSNAEYKKKKRDWLKQRELWPPGTYKCDNCPTLTTAPELDHIKRTGMGGSPDRLLDTDNWQLLCRFCHDKKDGGFK